MKFTPRTYLEKHYTFSIYLFILNLRNSKRTEQLKINQISPANSIRDLLKKTASLTLHWLHFSIVHYNIINSYFENYFFESLCLLAHTSSSWSAVFTFVICFFGQKQLASKVAPKTKMQTIAEHDFMYTVGMLWPNVSKCAVSGLTNTNLKLFSFRKLSMCHRVPYSSHDRHIWAQIGNGSSQLFFLWIKMLHMTRNFDCQHFF